MPTFSLKSKEILSTCHQSLQDVCNEAIKIYDFAVLEGYRPQEVQDKYYADGFSRVRFPDSKHNQTPALAVDIAPHPIDWEDLSRFNRLAGVMFSCAHMKGIKLRWGGTWGGLNDKSLTGFLDYPHFEITLT